jgi:hypothetical protein
VDWNRLLEPASLAMLIPILVIIWLIVLAVVRHRERMAMIASGMHPDASKQNIQPPGASKQP